MWELRCLTTLWAFMACCRDSFTFFIKNANIKVYSTVKHVALHGCEMLSFTLREEHRLRVFEIRVLRRIFGSKGKK
jgi:hypothetical protein